MSQSLPIEVASVKATNNMQDDTLHKADTIVGHSKMLQDNLQKLGLKIKHHEDNLKFLKTQTNNLDESIFDMQVSLGKYHSSTVADTGSQNLNHVHTEQNTIEQILRQEKTAAGILCQLKTRHGAQASNLPLTKDVLGIVATLGKVNDDNHSRFFSEYLGLESMLAVVCKTYEGVKALELYDQVGRIDKSVGLHGLGQSIGRPMDGRFRVICLEDLIPYAGKFVAEDPQKKLALLKPRLPSGDCPSGFLGFAVNMIHVDNTNLSCVTPSGHGLRETLFYYLFSHLQVYRTRVDMQLALPCISDGAISLDGGMIKGSGVFDLGNCTKATLKSAVPCSHQLSRDEYHDPTVMRNRSNVILMLDAAELLKKDMEVRFPIALGNSNLPGDIGETAERIKLMKWEKERIDEDIKREETLLNHAKNSFDLKRQEFVKFLGETSPYVTQNEVKAERK